LHVIIRRGDEKELDVAANALISAGLERTILPRSGDRAVVVAAGCPAYR